MSDPLSAGAKYAWDVFVSHATEDKDRVALPLAEKLKQAGLRPWLDRTDVDPGDNLRRKVNEGLSRSRFGVVILSDTFFEKKWTVDELDALMAMERPGHEIVIPLLHCVSPASLAERYPLLANRACLDTSGGLEHVAAEIIRVVLKRGSQSPSESVPTLRRRLLDLLDTAPDGAHVRQFLQHHSQILEHATGAHQPTVVWTPALGGFSPDVCVANYLPTTSRREWHVIVLASIRSELFPNGTDINPSIKKALDELEALRKWIPDNYVEARKTLSDINGQFRGVVVTGRRAELGSEQARRLEQYNDLLFGTRIRTYDWLVEAS
jgi:hypothetical protein